MPNLNLCQFMGNLTREPELKYTPKGTAVCNFSIAVNRKFTLESGEKREEVTFVDFECFAKTAEVIAQYVKKGRPIYVQARYKLETWEKDGEKRSRPRFHVESFEFLDSGKSTDATKPDDDKAPPDSGKSTDATKPDDDKAPPAGAPKDDSDIPF